MTKRNRTAWILVVALLCAGAFPTVMAHASGRSDGARSLVTPTTLSTELTNLRFDNGVAALQEEQSGNTWQGEDEAGDFRDGSTKPPGTKSPFKAFALSMVVPGAGQWYYGSKTKALLFFAVDVAAWGLQFKWHGDGVDMEDEFEAFNRQYWSRESYEEKYLYWVYGVTDDDELQGPVYGEVSHHLPDTRTQQYYEMTGKYNQFAWGWADAVYDGNTIDDYSVDNPMPAITGVSLTPQSTLREEYETMRADANSKLEDARKMVMVSIFNRIVSGLEAYFGAKRHNNSLQAFGAADPKIEVRASLESYNSRRDTPFLHVAWHF
ncbi:hypothetical protein KQH82_01420 [bacterium]|nr:hypothetical protein [bacterium]